MSKIKAIVLLASLGFAASYLPSANAFCGFGGGCGYRSHCGCHYQHFCRPVYYGYNRCCNTCWRPCYYHSSCCGGCGHIGYGGGFGGGFGGWW